MSGTSFLKGVAGRRHGDFSPCNILFSIFYNMRIEGACILYPVRVGVPKRRWAMPIIKPAFPPNIRCYPPENHGMSERGQRERKNERRKRPSLPFDTGVVMVQLRPQHWKKQRPQKSALNQERTFRAREKKKHNLKSSCEPESLKIREGINALSGQESA